MRLFGALPIADSWVAANDWPQQLACVFMIQGGACQLQYAQLQIALIIILSRIRSPQGLPAEEH